SASFVNWMSRVRFLQPAPFPIQSLNPGTQAASPSLAMILARLAAIHTIAPPGPPVGFGQDET
ncbi:MAG: hypothetical protein V4564_22970, partial [Pseudomonadota bacterium]